MSMRGEEAMTSMIIAYLMLGVWFIGNTYMLVASVRERNAYGVVMSLLLFIPAALLGSAIFWESIR